MTSVFENVFDTIQWFKDHCQCFDLNIRSIEKEDKTIYLIFLASLTDSLIMVSMVESVVLNEKKQFFPSSISETDDLDKALVSVLSGQCAILYPNNKVVYIAETRNYPTRGISEPATEKSVRGSRDGFVEHILLNIGLIRRKIRDENLYMQLVQKGLNTKTDIAYMYITNLVNQTALQDFLEKLNTMDNRENLLSERHFIRALYGKSRNPYPHVRYTERPDIAAIHLMEGNIVIIVDNSSTVIIIPTTFFDLTKQIEEYTQTPIIASMTRIIRFTGILASIYLLPIWMMMVIDRNPTMLQIPMPEIPNVLTFGIQILIADFVIEWIRLSLIHTPYVLSGLMGVVTVFVLGDTPVELGVFTKEILILISIVNIGNFVTASYEMSMANKFIRMAMVVFVIIGGYYGLLLAIFLHFLLLVNTMSSTMPYLYPFIPFNRNELRRVLVGSSYKKKK